MLNKKIFALTLLVVLVVALLPVLRGRGLSVLTLYIHLWI